MKKENFREDKLHLVSMNLQDLKLQIISMKLNEDIDVMYLMHIFEKCFVLLNQNRFHLASFWYAQAKLFKSKSENLCLEKLSLTNLYIEIDNLLNCSI